MRRPLPFAMLVLLGVVVDQLTKGLAFWLIPPNGFIPLVRGIFHFTHATNQGVAFSMLSGRPLVILAITLVTVPVLIWWYTKTWRTGPASLVAGQGLILSGALGNLMDRAIFGYVRDFLDFVPPLPLINKWAIFNVADAFICVGVALFLYAEWFASKPAEQPVKGPEVKSQRSNNEQPVESPEVKNQNSSDF